jgi:23S rRNA pseudouridine2605 synthase
MKTSHGPGRVSLPRAISKLGFASRSQANGLIQGGSVSVNGKVELNPHRWVDIEHDRIEIQSQTLKRLSFRYVVLHKPPGVVTTSSDERGQRTVFDVMGAGGKGLMPVGRLDKESTGLLLFTNDHQFANLLTSPQAGLLKTYIASLDQPMRLEDLRALSEGIEIQIRGEQVFTKPVHVSAKRPLEIEIGITEGKNRQIRRMFEELGYQVTKLQRIAVGPFRLQGLTEGQSRELTVEEVSTLRSAVESKETPAVHQKRKTYPRGKNPGGGYHKQSR